MIYNLSTEKEQVILGGITKILNNYLIQECSKCTFLTGSEKMSSAILSASTNTRSAPKSAPKKTSNGSEMSSRKGASS